MEIQLGSIYVNKTKKFLMPSLLSLGDGFRTKYENLFKLAIGLGDFTLMHMGVETEHSIFILIDTNFSRTHFKKTIEWLRAQSFYKLDYPYDDIHTGHLHMVVIEIPEDFKDTAKQFKEGKYSKMYNYSELTEFFMGKEEELAIFNRDPKKLEEFIENVNKKFNTNVDSIGWKGEIELPLEDNEEYFNVKLYKNTQR